MSDKVAELVNAVAQDDTAAFVSQMWDTYDRQRAGWKAEVEELYKYIFATDTRSTSNNKLPWKNSTTLPKLTQIRDNLHANYSASLFPNDKYIKWEGYSKEDATKEKAKNITSYMSNKVREGGLKHQIDKMLLDYIDTGNAFAMPSFENRYIERNGERIADFVGPVGIRISPMDIVFNPLASSFKYTPKIIRSVKTIGEIKKLAMTHPEQKFWEEAIQKREAVRKRIQGGQYKSEDFEKANLYTVDGFGNIFEYLMSEYVEILTFYGDYHDQETGELKLNQQITVTDRSYTADVREVMTYDGTVPIYHTGWRKRPFNLWSMGPLANLVGMQYRIDHLENLKADAMDLVVHPPKKIFGEVEQFEWGPDSEIHIDVDGDVQTFAQDMNAIITAENNIALLEQKMEQYSGAPREASGIRSPGEKTMYEVQALENAAGRIFQVKINQFEEELFESLLNGMLEEAHRNFAGNTQIRTYDSDIGVVSFTEITKEDITAKGILRPVGARHFAKKAQELQNLIGISTSPLFAKINPHLSSLKLTSYFEDALDIRAYNLFRPNVAVQEERETQSLVNQAQEDMVAEDQTPFEDEMAGV